MFKKAKEDTDAQVSGENTQEESLQKRRHSAAAFVKTVNVDYDMFVMDEGDLKKDVRVKTEKARRLAFFKAGDFFMNSKNDLKSPGKIFSSKKRANVAIS